jgi:D-galactarolactone cycloisomerase
MLIKEINTIPLRVPYADPDAGTASAHYLVLVRIETQSGLVGYGEALAYLPSMQAPLCAVLDTIVKPAALGKNAGAINSVIHDIEFEIAPFGRNGLVTNALAALEMAMWDALGRRANVSLHELLGGAVRHQIPCIASLNRYDDEDVAFGRAKRAVAGGFCGVKAHEKRVSVIRSVKEAIGSAVKLMIDVNCGWSAEAAFRYIPVVMEWSPRWIEDPIWPPENVAGLREIKRRLNAPLATGGDISGIWRFADLIRSGVVTFVQPDICIVGGIGPFCRVAEYAQVHNITLAPHTPFQGPAMLACLHVMATRRDECFYAWTFVDFESSMYGASGRPVGGILNVPTGPGLGPYPDPQFLKEYRTVLK